MSDKTDYRALNKQLSAEINYITLGHHMKNARKQCGMTQAEMAEKMKLGVKYYAALEIGKAKIKLVRLIQFISITQVSADTLLIGTHADYPSRFSHRIDNKEKAYTERDELHHLIDRCSDETIETILVITKALKEK